MTAGIQLFVGSALGPCEHQRFRRVLRVLMEMALELSHCSTRKRHCPYGSSRLTGCCNKIVFFHSQLIDLTQEKKALVKDNKRCFGTIVALMAAATVAAGTLPLAPPAAAHDEPRRCGHSAGPGAGWFKLRAHGPVGCEKARRVARRAGPTEQPLGSGNQALWAH